MPRIRAYKHDRFLRSSVSADTLNSVIREIRCIRRPLNTKFTRSKLGEMVSHTGVLLLTDETTLVVELMDVNQVFIGEIPDFDRNCNVVCYRKYVFVYDEDGPFYPNERITVRDFAETMVSNISKKGFNTFSRNCHQTRYKTLKHFGMSIKPPSLTGRSTFVRGFKEFFSHKNRVDSHFFFQSHKH